MENEIMNNETEVMEPEFEAIEMATENSGIGTGTAMLIGAGLTLATTAIVRLGKKAWAKYKAKKELRLVEESETVEPTEEQIMDVAK